MVNLTRDDRTRYILRNSEYGNLVVADPIGIDKDDEELFRHQRYYGFMSKDSSGLKFILDSADYIKLVRDTLGIKASIQLIKEQRHPHTDVWTFVRSGFLDLSTFVKEKGQVSVKYSSGGLESLLKSRESQKADLEKTKSLNGKDIGELITQKCALDGRELFLETIFEARNRSLVMYNETKTSSPRGVTHSVPLSLKNKSHENAHEPLEGAMVGDNSYERTGSGETAIMFFAVADRPRVLKIKLDLSCLVTKIRYDRIANFLFYIRVGKYKDGINYTSVESDFLYGTDQVEAINNKIINAGIEKTYYLEAGESLALTFDQVFNPDENYINTARLSIGLSNIVANLNIKEYSTFPPTQTKMLFVKDVAERLMAFYTGKKGLIKTDTFGKNGLFEYLAMAHGFWIRGFDKLPIPDPVNEVSNLYKSPSLSFKELTESLDAILPIGIGFERDGNKEVVRLEDRKHFFNRNVLIVLPNAVENVKESESASDYYSTLEFGYSKGGQYEEIFGLYEPNGRTTWATTIDEVTNALIKISPTRADSTGIELTRRKQENLNKTVDTNADEDLFFIDAKPGVTEVYQQRKWQDDLKEEPSGIVSVETATHLRLSPLNNMLRAAWTFSGTFDLYENDKVVHGNSTGNAQLKTKLFDYAYREDDDILNSELEKGRFKPVEIEFEHEVDFFTMQQIQGKSIIFGKEVFNFYGLVEFKYKNGEVDRGFLLKVGLSTGKWKVIKLFK